MAKEKYRLKVVIKRGDQFGTVFWATWQQDQVYYGSGHAGFDGQYLKTSYHGDGKQHTFWLGNTRDEREIHPRIVPLADFRGPVKRASKILTPDLHEVSWQAAPPMEDERLQVLIVPAEEIRSWPLTVLNFWLIAGGRDDLVADALRRSTMRDTFVLEARTHPQMLAFFSGPTQEEIEGVAFVMREGPPA